jgi:hypothetical protein
MIIAHRTIISIYDMSKKCFKEEHFSFKNFIRFMALKKNSKKARLKQEKKAEDRFDQEHSKTIISLYQQYSMIVFTGINIINPMRLTSQGELKRQSKFFKQKGRILKIVDDFG